MSSVTDTRVSSIRHAGWPENQGIGKGDVLPVRPVLNRRQWVRKDPGHDKLIYSAGENAERLPCQPIMN